jgi:hypothetical protein
VHVSHVFKNYYFFQLWQKCYCFSFMIHVFKIKKKYFVINFLRIKMWKKNVKKMSWITKRKEINITLDKMDWKNQKNQNIVTSIFLKLDYIYLIKLIKQIKYFLCNVHVSHVFKNYYFFQLWQKCYCFSFMIHVFKIKKKYFVINFICFCRGIIYLICFINLIK